VPKGTAVPRATLDLQVGEKVRVKPYKEILKTLDSTYRNRGLYFDAEMVPFTEREYEVERRQKQIIDEASGKMIRFKTDAIILKDISSRDFSIATFYERRVRRIFPALIVTLLGTSCLAYLYFLPAELVNFAKSLLAALFSASNFYFWKHSGYFSAPVETIPLIHTWSLAVEEQFYVFLPIFLAAAHRYFPRKVRLSVILIAVLSFIVSAVGAFRYPTATFYLAHTRAWELMLGVLISLEVFPAISRPMLRNLATAAGIALICFAVFAYSSATPFPGIAALAPCAGAALIVAAGRSGSSLVGRVLSLKPVTFIGLISYSLYLWHWPIIVFQTMESPLMSGASVRAAKLISIFVSLAVATLSWKFVETPFRGW